MEESIVLQSPWWFEYVLLLLAYASSVVMVKVVRGFAGVEAVSFLTLVQSTVVALAALFTFVGAMSFSMFGGTLTGLFLTMFWDHFVKPRLKDREASNDLKPPNLP